MFQFIRCSNPSLRSALKLFIAGAALLQQIANFEAGISTAQTGDNR
jgi:hypothetical protein